MKRIRVWLPLLITMGWLVPAPPSYAEQAGSAVHRVAAASLASGGFHSCALLAAGTVRCWGDNNQGALGTATGYQTVIPAPTPAPAVPLGGRAVAVAAGENHSCALLTSGAVRCWGSNHAGELGTGALLGSTSYVPQPAVALGGRATGITAAAGHTCALLAAGTVRCWGENGSGQLGSTVAGSTYLPQPAVPLGARATAVATGSTSTCALLTTGKVRCWGSNQFGQLGSATNASTTTANPRPLAAVPLDARATAISVGSGFACALLATGTVRCWGENNGGQLGSPVNAGLMAANPYPLPAPPLGAAATAITTGAEHTCAVLATGTVRCWGYNFLGQTGSATNMGTGTPTPAPQPALTFTDNAAPSAAVAVEAGDYFSCALTAAGHVHCWGGNSPYGQIGTDQSTGSTSTPVLVALDGVRVRAATALAMRARPTTDRRAPYAFGISGRVTGAYAADAATCTGRLSVRLKRGTHTLASRTVTLSPTCTWHATLTAPTGGLARGRNRLTVTATLRAIANLAAAHRSLRVTAVR